MPKAPRPTGKEMLNFLLRRGFVVVRVRGSHHVMEGGLLKTNVPVHGNKNLKTGTFNGILKDIKMSTKDFADEWHK